MPVIFPLPIDGDFYYLFKLTNPDGTAKTGLDDVTTSISLVDGGDPITGLTKYTATETATLGTYAASMPETDLASISANVGTSAYVVVYEGAKTLSSDPCVITAAARAG